MNTYSPVAAGYVAEYSNTYGRGEQPPQKAGFTLPVVALDRDGNACVIDDQGQAVSVKNYKAGDDRVRFSKVRTIAEKGT